MILLFLFSVACCWLFFRFLIWDANRTSAAMVARKQERKHKELGGDRPDKGQAGELLIYRDDIVTIERVETKIDYKKEKENAAAHLARQIDALHSSLQKSFDFNDYIKIINSIGRCAKDLALKPPKNLLNSPSTNYLERSREIKKNLPSLYRHRSDPQTIFEFLNAGVTLVFLQVLEPSLFDGKATTVNRLRTRMLHINPEAFMSLSAQLCKNITDNGELLKAHRKILGSFLELQDDISHAKQILKDLETSTPGLGRHALITDLINLLYQTLPFKVINRKTLTIFARLDIKDIRKTIIDMHDFLLAEPSAPLGHTHKENSVRKYSAENWKKIVESEHYQLPSSIRSIDFLEELYTMTGNEEDLTNLSKLRREIKYVKLINDAEGQFPTDDFEDIEFQPPAKHAS